MNGQTKYEIIKKLVEEGGNKERAALELSLTRRQVNRLCRAYRERGKAAFIHGNSGRKPSTALPEELRRTIVDLYRTKYYDANFTHFQELLSSHEQIHVSVSSISSILESEYILSPKVTKRKKKRIKAELAQKREAAKTQREAESIQQNLVALEDAHPRRPRCAHFGELIQMDAASYEWVPGQTWHLHVAIDDATGIIVGAWFDTQETLDGYYHVFYQILTTYGIPYQFLTDKRTVFTYKKKNVPSLDEDTYTQFAYACKQLGTGIESSSIPQAKGRVERLNATLQARLPVELRLAGVTTLNGANEFLPAYLQKFNEKFSLPIHRVKSVFEDLPSVEKINLSLAVLVERTVDSGHSVQFQKKYYRMLDAHGTPVCYRKGTKVLVIKAFDGRLFCSVNDQSVYALEAIPEHEEKSKELDADYKEPKPHKQDIPSMSHPWKRSTYKKFVHSQAHHRQEDPITA